MQHNRCHHPRSSVGLAALSLTLAATGWGCASTDEKSGSPSEATNSQVAPETPPIGKLPTHTRPLSYALELTIDPRQTHFSGQVEIEIETDVERSVLWLHGAKFVDVQADYTSSSGTNTKLHWEQMTEQGLARLSAEKPLPAGRGRLSFRYRAPFDEDLKGLYRWTEKSETGEDHYAFTQFEPTEARFCFPSFDEPRFKVPFDLAVHARDVVITTTPEVSVTAEADGFSLHRFAKTPALPTYLIAFAVGPLEVIESAGLPANEVRREPLPFRGIAVKGRGEKLAYAMRETGKILSALEAYFGQPYPFAKLDIIAVPDFAAGAMENPGAVTFREWLLLVDEETAPTSQRRAFAGVMAHELAHMWFGNLVTMPWWDDIWLNEAFATWMGFKITGRVYPEYEVELSYVEGVAHAMSSDSRLSARQIRQPIESDNDIINAFDSITYRKGGAVLTMFERYLSPEVFRDGVRRYLRKHARGSATYEDLLAALGEASGQDVATPFSTFLFQPGVPLVDAKLVCNGDQAEVTLKQSRYFPLGSKGLAEPTLRGQNWQLPICVRYGSGKAASEVCTLLREKEGKLVLPEKCPDWIMPNAAHAGYYRWTLDVQDLGRLAMQKAKRRPGRAQAALPPKLTIAEWLSVADAIRIGFSSGRLDTGATLRALLPLAGHPHRSLATAPFSTFNFIYQRLSDNDDERAEVARFIAEAYRPQLDRLGVTGKKDDSKGDRELRASVLRFLIEHPEPASQQKPNAPARQRKKNARSTTMLSAINFSAIDLEKTLAPLGRRALGLDATGPLPDPDLAAVAVLAAVRADPKTFTEARSMLKSEKDPVKRGWILGALAATKDELQAEQHRALALDESLRANEVTRIVFTSFRDRDRRPAAWQYFQNHYEAILERTPTFRRGSLPWIASFGCSQTEADATKLFFAPRVKDLNGGPRNLDSALEAAQLCMAKKAHHQESARAFFAGRATP